MKLSTLTQSASLLTSLFDAKVSVTQSLVMFAKCRAIQVLAI